MSGYNIAIVGATGAVGTRMRELLEETTLPLNEVHLLASAKSEGKKLAFKGMELTVHTLTKDSFKNIDIALFSAGGSISKEFAPIAVDSGAVVIDNTSAFRMTEGVPLVVPEVNPEALQNHQGLIANPNCSTIQMVVALAPIRKTYGLKRVIVSTYQAVSGAGQKAIEELENESQAVLNHEPVTPTRLPVASAKKHYQIAFNALAQIDVFAEDDYTFEEWKMRNETQKIFSDPSIGVAATCVRIPVVIGHSESVYLETEKEAKVADVQALLAQSAGIILEDNPKTQLYPQAINAAGRKETFVGRIRRDLDYPTGLHLWVVSDNLLKGAAWNTVQIAETLHAKNLVRVPEKENK